MFKKSFILILLFISGFVIWNYNNDTHFLLKNQNTIVNFLDHNQFEFEFDLDLKNEVFHSILISDYKVFGKGSFYYLNNNAAGFINLGFDNLKFEQFKLSFLIDGSDLYFRISNNTFTRFLDLDFLGTYEWHKIALNDLIYTFDFKSVFKYLAIKDGSNENLLISASDLLLSEFNYKFLNDLEMLLTNKSLVVNENFMNASVHGMNFSGQLPIIKPSNFKEFYKTLD